MGLEDACAYAAGVLDSDGFFTIVRDGSYNPDSPYYRIKIGVKQLWPGQGLRLIASVLGGRVAFERRAQGQRHMARWELYSSAARDAIIRVKPYLLLKRRQADLLLKTFRLIEMNSAPTGRTRQRVERNRDTIQHLNRHEIPYPEGRQSTKGSLEQVTHVIEKEQLRSPYAYLAGVMDSDGSFKIERRRVKGMINPHYRIKIAAAQVAPSPAIELLAEVFGGTIRVRNYDGPSYKAMTRWSLYDKSAVPALEALLPHLVIKTPQARLLLQMRQLKAKGKLGTTEWVHKTRWQRPIKMRKRCYSPEQVREFDRLYRIVKALHNDSPPYELPTSGRAGGTESPS